MENNFVFTPINSAVDMIKATLKSGVVPMLHGSPAIGKSSLAQSIADGWDLLLLDERLTSYDAGEINGLMNFNEDRSRSQFIPMENFPLEGEAIPINPATGKPYKGWLLFLDELSSASRAVMAAAYKLILDRKVGKHKLHSHVMMMAAGNLDTDGAIVNQMGSALRSRMVNYYLMPDFNAWRKIMQQAGRIDYRIISFLEYKKDMFFNFDPETTDDTFGSPRTYEMLSKQLKHIKPGNEGFKSLALISGTIGASAGRAFASFIEYFDKLTDIKEIEANPTGAKIPSEVSYQFAMAGKLGVETNQKNADAVFKYLGRMDMEFQYIAVRAMSAHYASLPAAEKGNSAIGSSALSNWSKSFAHNMWG